MLCLTRKIGESIIIDHGIRVMVGTIKGNQVKLIFEAPKDINIWREELGENGFKRQKKSAEVQ